MAPPPAWAGTSTFTCPAGVDVVDVGYMVPGWLGRLSQGGHEGPVAHRHRRRPDRRQDHLPTDRPGHQLHQHQRRDRGAGRSPLRACTAARLPVSTATPASSTPPTPTPPMAPGSSSPATGTPAALNKLRLLAFTPANGKTITNNSGDTVVPCNKWDAEQLFAWGVKGTHLRRRPAARPSSTTATAAATRPGALPPAPAAPRAAMPGTLTGTSGRPAARRRLTCAAAMGNDEIGPWQRIQYPGSRVSFDQAGLDSTVLGYASIDASNIGYAVSSWPHPLDRPQPQGRPLGGRPAHRLPARVRVGQDQGEQHRRNHRPIRLPPLQG